MFSECGMCVCFSEYLCFLSVACVSVIVSTCVF